MSTPFLKNKKIFLKRMSMLGPGKKCAGSPVVIILAHKKMKRVYALSILSICASLMKVAFSNLI